MQAPKLGRLLPVGLAARQIAGLLVFATDHAAAADCRRSSPASAPSSPCGVEDYFAAGKRWRVRLHEKDGRQHEMPAHHKLEAFRPRRGREDFDLSAACSSPLSEEQPPSRSNDRCLALAALDDPEPPSADGCCSFQRRRCPLPDRSDRSTMDDVAWTQRICAMNDQPQVVGYRSSSGHSSPLEIGTGLFL
jgi:hypothetical protein